MKEKIGPGKEGKGWWREMESRWAETAWEKRMKVRFPHLDSAHFEPFVEASLEGLSKDVGSFFDMDFTMHFYMFLK